MYRPERTIGPFMICLPMRRRRSSAPTLVLRTTRVPPDWSGSIAEIRMSCLAHIASTDWTGASRLMARLKSLWPGASEETGKVCDRGGTREALLTGKRERGWSLCHGNACERVLRDVSRLPQGAQFVAF